MIRQVCLQVYMFAACCVCLCFLLYIYIYIFRFCFLFFWGLIETVRSCFGNTIASVSIDIPASCQEYSQKGSWLVFSFNTATFSNCTPQVYVPSECVLADNWKEMFMALWKMRQRWQVDTVQGLDLNFRTKVVVRFRPVSFLFFFATSRISNQYQIYHIYILPVQTSAPHVEF